jgi:DNA-binding beta-propeller fold protein YncE
VREFRDSSGRPFARATETVIGFNDPAMNQDSVLASPDGQRIAYVVMASDGLAVVADGVRGPVFQGLVTESMVFSPGGAHLAYVGILPGRQCVVLDGEVHEYRGVGKQGVVFSPDGRRHAWIAASHAGQLAVIDGVESPPYEGVGPRGVVFSADGAHAAYTATSGGKTFVVLDGEDGPLFDEVLGPWFTTGSHRSLYVGLDGAQFFAVVDGVPRGPFDEFLTENRGSEEEPDLDAFVLSADGSAYGYAAATGGQWSVYAGERAFGPYERVRSLTLSPDGRRTAFVGLAEEGWFVIVDGEQHLKRVPDSLTFSPDGKRLGLVARRGNAWIPMVDGVEGELCDRIEPPGIRFSPVGSRTAWVAEREGQLRVIVDGVAGPPFRSLGATPLGFLAGSARAVYSIRRGDREVLVVDGAQSAPWKSYRPVVVGGGGRFAYAAEKDEKRWVVVVDGVEFGPGGARSGEDAPTFTSIARGSPFFSEDGAHVAWAAEAEGAWFAFRDGAASGPYEIVMRSTLSFSPDGRHFAFAAQKAGNKRIVVDGLELVGDWDGFLARSDFLWSGPARFSVRGIRNPRLVRIEIELL